MKKFCSILIISGLMSCAVQGQIHLFLEEQEVDLKDATSAAWVFPVVRDLDEALNDLKDYCKERSNIKMKKAGDNMLIAEKVSLPSIATKRGDLIGYGFITENYYAIALVFQMGYDIAVNSQEWEVEMKSFRNYAREFMSYHYDHAYARKVEALEKEIKSLEKEINQHENKIAGMTKKIENLNKKSGKETDETKIALYQNEITTLEADIQVLTEAIPGMQSQVDNHQNQVDQLRSEVHAYLGTIGTL